MATSRSSWSFPGGLNGKEITCQWRRHIRCQFDPWLGKILRSRKWKLTPVFLSGEFHGQKSLVGYSPWGLKESDTTEHLRTHTQALLLGERKKQTTINLAFNVCIGRQILYHWATWKAPGIQWISPKFYVPVQLPLLPATSTGSKGK